MSKFNARNITVFEDAFAMGSAEPMRKREGRTGEGRDRNNRSEAIRCARRKGDGHFNRRAGLLQDARAAGWL